MYAQKLSNWVGACRPSPESDWIGLRCSPLWLISIIKKTNVKMVFLQPRCWNNAFGIGRFQTAEFTTVIHTWCSIGWFLSQGRWGPMIYWPPLLFPPMWILQMIYVICLQSTSISCAKWGPVCAQKMAIDVHCLLWQLWSLYQHTPSHMVCFMSRLWEDDYLTWRDGLKYWQNLMHFYCDS